MRASTRVFISATSGDLGTVRQLVKEALLSMDCHPVEQTSFPPDYRGIQNVLQDTNRLAEAEPLMRRALAIFQDSLGLDHPSTKTVASNLQSLLTEKNGVGEA